MPPYKPLRKLNMYEAHLKTLSGRRCNWLKSSTIRPSCVEASAQGLGRAQPSLISTALRARRVYLNIK